MITIGIDVSKNFLDLYETKKKSHHKIKNEEADIHKFLSTFVGLDEEIRLVMESTGTYQNKMQKIGNQLDFSVYIVNPYRIKSYAQAMGKRSKTDKIDCKIIADFAENIPLKSMFKRTENQLKLGELLRARSCLVVQKTAIGNVHSCLELDSAKMPVSDLLDCLSNQLKTLEEEIESIIKNDNDLHEKSKLLQSAPGVGRVSSWTILAFLPELGHLSRNEIAALCGVAPMTRESGSWKGKSAISGGRECIRNALYMCIMSIYSHKKGPLYLFIKKLIEKGKPFKVAAVAAMRKLIVCLNAMVKNNQEWQPEYETSFKKQEQPCAQSELDNNKPSAQSEPDNDECKIFAEQDINPSCLRGCLDGYQDIASPPPIVKKEKDKKMKRIS